MPHDETLFAGTAEYYARYRVPYPQALIDDLVAHYQIDGTGRLLDLGCGPGTLTLPLAPHFAEIVAVDPQPEMIEVARKSAAPNIAWHVMRAEDVPASLGPFRLMTCGSSFHWMDRDLVLRRTKDEWLEPGAGVALAGGGSAWWDGKEDWHHLITGMLRKYLGDPRKAGRAGWIRYQTQERFEQTLPRNGWRLEFYKGYELPLEWTVDRLVGHLWSSSFAARPHFGDRADEFERELRAELAALRPEGIFREIGDFGLVCGRPPS